MPPLPSRIRTLLVHVMLVALVACRAPAAGIRALGPGGDGPRVLVVTAHPDDELLFAGSLYKLATHLAGSWDLLVITNGEGGFKYSTLSERLYGLALTDEVVGRAHLPRIRARELEEGIGYLGARELEMLGEADHRYTQDEREVLAADARVWDLDRIRQRLRARLARGYDFVFLMPPTADTHGHHKAATLLALEVLASLPAEERPIALCATLATSEDPALAPPEFAAGFVSARLRTGVDAFEFDRRQPFGHMDRLDYRIVVDWAIAAHKSQGTMQTLMRRGEVERFWLFDCSPPEAAERSAALFARLAEPQFEPRTYGASAGTNVAPR